MGILICLGQWWLHHKLFHSSEGETSGGDMEGDPKITELGVAFKFISYR